MEFYQIMDQHDISSDLEVSVIDGVITVSDSAEDAYFSDSVEYFLQIVGGEENLDSESAVNIFANRTDSGLAKYISLYYMG